MSVAVRHHDGADESPLQLLGRLGLSVLTCDPEGALVNDGLRGGPLADLLSSSPVFRERLHQAADGWARTRDAGPGECLAGLWLAPVPLRPRGRLEGYTVVVMAADRVVAEGEGPSADPGLEPGEVKRRLGDMPPVAETDVPRLAALARAVIEQDQCLASRSAAVESVGGQLAESYEEINHLYTIIRNMTEVERPEKFVSLACRELLKTLPYRWIAFVFAHDASRLAKLAGRFVLAGAPREPEATIRDLAARLLASEPVRQAIVLEPTANPAHAAYAAFGATALVHPVASDEVRFGLFIAGDMEGADGVASSVDMKLLEATATHTAIFLENAALYDDLNTTFLGTLEALTASIDAKDRYTCGHSERVAHLTQRLGVAIGLDEAMIARMHIAGLVHDVGKIGVPERVLIKPGKLSDEEFAWIKRHPEIGYGILKDIPQLRDVLPGVLHHHERWDGRGYPSGLAGEDIPLLGRLIALADSFDAMSSDRTYRARLTRVEALAEIEDCAGSQFDPTLAPVFVRLDFGEFDRMIQRHSAQALGQSPAAA